MTLTVLVTDRVSDEGLASLLDDHRFTIETIYDSASDEFEAILTSAAGLIVRSATKVDAEMIARAPGLQVVGRAGVGIDNIDLAAASKRGIAVFNAPGGNTNAASELTMALILALARRLPEADRSIREGRWDRASFKGIELKGRTLGLVGAGRIGGEVARRCKVFGMEVLVYDPYLPEERAEQLGVRLVSLEHVIENADVISCHVPLTDETRGLIDAPLFGRMKDRVLVVNASRGGVIDEEALAQALHEGMIAGAALDVFEREPLSPESPLRNAPNLVLTPHLGASTEEAQVGVATEVAGYIRAALGEGDLSAAVNAADLE
jgi:D-3-phosphoglycerate dehydrogenase / 2-oxoglutarate reductase